MVALEVKSRDSDFENVLKEREKNNSKYLFLTDYKVRIASAWLGFPLVDRHLSSIGGTNTIGHWYRATSRLKLNLKMMYDHLSIC